MEKKELIIIFALLIAFATIGGLFGYAQGQATQTKPANDSNAITTIANFVILNAQAQEFLSTCKVTQDNNTSVVLTCLK
jgi:hypothetical protein